MSGVYDVAVVGDEVESVLTAVSAARFGARTALIHPRGAGNGLGGLSTRGGLCYMDITPGLWGALFAEFLTRAGVRRVALYAPAANEALVTMLHESGASVYARQAVTPRWEADDRRWRLDDPSGKGRPLFARILIDATPDADIARALKVRYTEGLGGLFGPECNFLGVTPVFQTQGVDREGLIAFEASLRQSPRAADYLAAGLPHLTPIQREELLVRPVVSPPDDDYIDILNPLIGVAFHVWRGAAASDYPQAEIAVDGFNIARLPNETLGFNGLVMRGRDLDSLLRYSRGEGRWPQGLQEALQDFERFLQDAGGFRRARVLAPQALYVRQTLNIQSRRMMTAGQALGGGVEAEDAIGAYSYWLDLRGITLAAHYPGESLAKPLFNVGLGPALALLPGGPMAGDGRFAVVGRSAGYSPLGQGAGRIIQHNALLGEAVGIAAGMMARTRARLSEAIPGEIRAVMTARGMPPAKGRAVEDAEVIAQSALLQADAEVTARLQAGV